MVLFELFKILLGSDYLDIVGKGLFRYYWEGNDKILLGRNCSYIIGKGMIRYCWEGIVQILLGRE